MLFEDPFWPRASAWLESAASDPALVVVGVPTSVGSLSPSEAWRTPSRFREVVARFASFDGEHGTDLAALPVADAGDWDLAAASLDTVLVRTQRKAAELAWGPVYAFIGGDNTVTRPLVEGLAQRDLGAFGVLTFDAHHDVRTLDLGPRNGTPIRGLIADGMPGANVTQIGIHSFSNSAAYRAWCDEHSITVHTMAEVDRNGIDVVVDEALADLATRCDHIYVDFDLDVLDRAFAPACPGSRPGGLTPRQLAAAARLCGRHPKVVAADFVEVDAAVDRDDVTVMNLVSTFLWFAAGVAGREGVVS